MIRWRRSRLLFQHLTVAATLKYENHGIQTGVFMTISLPSYFQFNFLLILNRANFRGNQSLDLASGIPLNSNE